MLINLSKFEPIGLASIATYVYMGDKNRNIIIVDNEFDDVDKIIHDFIPDIIGISAFTIQYCNAIKLAKKIKESYDCPIILGGIHTSTLPESLDPVFTAGVVGEGEVTFNELVERFEREKSLQPEQLFQINGLVYFNEGNITITPARHLVDPLDKLPIIDRSFINLRYYDEQATDQDNITKFINIETSRGCPYNCKFCSPKVMWKRVRYYSIGRVVNEIRSLYEEYNIDVISPVDDLFIRNKKYVFDLINALKENNLLGKIRFVGHGRTDLFDDELCELLKELNVESLNFGFESNSKKVLQYLKGHNIVPEDNINAVNLCKKYGFHFNGFFVFGSPIETTDDMLETEKFIDYIEDISANADLYVLILVPLPGTEIWKYALSMGKVSTSMDWDVLSFQNLDNLFFIEGEGNIKEFKVIFNRIRSKKIVRN